MVLTNGVQEGQSMTPSWQQLATVTPIIERGKQSNSIFVKGPAKQAFVCKEDITSTQVNYFSQLYNDNDRAHAKLDDFEFHAEGEQEADWLERRFEEGEKKKALKDLWGDQAPGLNGFPSAFF